MQFVSHVFRRMEGGAFSRTEMVFEHGDAERVTTVFNSVGCSYLLSVSHWSESVIGAGSSALEFKEVIEAVRLPEPIKAWAAQ